MFTADRQKMIWASGDYDTEKASILSLETVSFYGILHSFTVLSMGKNWADVGGSMFTEARAGEDITITTLSGML